MTFVYPNTWIYTIRVISGYITFEEGEDSEGDKVFAEANISDHGDYGDCLDHALKHERPLNFEQEDVLEVLSWSETRH